MQNCRDKLLSLIPRNEKVLGKVKQLWSIKSKSSNKVSVINTVIGALGYVPKCLEIYIHQLNFNKIETEKLAQKLQNVSASGTSKLCKML